MEKKRAEPVQANNYSVLGMRVFRRTDTEVATFSKVGEVREFTPGPFWQMETTKKMNHSKNLETRWDHLQKVPI